MRNTYQSLQMVANYKYHQQASAPVIRHPGVEGTSAEQSISDNYGVIPNLRPQPQVKSKLNVKRRVMTAGNKRRSRLQSSIAEESQE